MSEEKTYVFDGGNSLSSLVPLLQNNGIDPNVLYAMNNGGFGGQGGWYMWIFFLMMLWGRGGYGFGNNGDGTGFLASQLNNDYGRDVLLQAINGNQLFNSCTNFIPIPTIVKFDNRLVILPFSFKKHDGLGTFIVREFFQIHLLSI